MAIHWSENEREEPTWVPANETILVDGREISGGMFYVGYQEEDYWSPFFVNPNLPVDWAQPDWRGKKLKRGTITSYGAMRPGERSAFLTWINDGRSFPGIGDDYVDIFLSGCIKQLDLDSIESNSAYLRSQSDFRGITFEMRRVVDHYRVDRRWHQTQVDFAEALLLYNGDSHLPIDYPSWRVGYVSAVLLVVLGRFMAEGQPIPAEWALSYLRNNNELQLRKPAERCPLMFDRLFLERYRATFGDGLSVKPPKQNLIIRSRGSRKGVKLGALRNIGSIKGPTNKLKRLADECCSELNTYDRFVRDNPTKSDSIEAIGLLPDVLFEEFGGSAFDELRSWTSDLLATERQPTVRLDDLVEKWSPGRIEKLKKRDASDLATALGKIGVSIEPDVRFGSSTPKPGTHCVLFSSSGTSQESPSAKYEFAASLIHMTAIVAAADGHISESERAHVARHFEAIEGLKPAEHIRLDAHLSFLALGKIGTAGLKKKVERIPVASRSSVADFLVGVAVADGAVEPKEINGLVKLFSLLGFEESDVYSRLHQFGSADSELVTVLDGESAPDWTIPPPASEKLPAGFQLDAEKVKVRLKESAEVSALLDDIFSDEETPQTEPEPVLPDKRPPGETLLGLDRAHSTLILELSKRQSWSREDVESLASSIGLPLVDGALDRINEAAMDACDEPIVEEASGELHLNSYAIEELL